MVLGGDPTIQAPATAWNIRTNVRNNRGRLYIANSAEIKLRRQAKAFAHIAPFSYGALASFIAGDDAAAEALARPAQTLPHCTTSATPSAPKSSSSFSSASEFRGADLKRLLDFGTTLPNRKFALLSDYANSRGAADMGLLPDMLPGYTPLAGNTTFAEYNTPTERGLDMLEIFEAAGRGELSALYVVGSNPIARYGVDPAVLQNTFVVVQEMFLTETAALADVILPAANLYEKSGIRHQQLRRSPTRQEGRRPRRSPQRLRDDRPHRRQDGREHARTRPVRQRHSRRHGPDPRRAVW